MYLAHKCPTCDHDVVMHFQRDTVACASCEYKETTETFWKIYRHEDYLRWLDHEIETTYPLRDISLIHSAITLAVGNHVLGRFAERDSNIAHAIQSHQKLAKDFNVCCSSFDVLERTKDSYRDIAQRHDDEHTRKYQCNIDTLDSTFQDLIQQLKNAAS